MKVITMQKEKRYWSVNILNLQEKTIVEYSWGAIGGKETEKIKEYTKGKNMGRSNETSHREQAMKEIESAARKKADKGYIITFAWTDYLIKEIKTKSTIKPMLASPFTQKRIDGQEQVYIQPKFDGCRCLAYLKDGEIMLQSRGGKTFELSHIESNLNLLRDYGNIILDGELYIHGEDFQDIISAVKKENDLTNKLEYHLFDCIVTDDKSINFECRYQILKNLMPDFYPYGDSIKLVPSYKVEAKQIKNTYENYLDDGYEGAIVRVDTCEYKQDKRSTQLLKYKPINDAEFKVIDYLYEIMANNKKGVIYRCVTDQGKAFNVRPTGKMKDRSEAYDKGFDSIGREYTVKFQGLTLDGIPRFPIGKGFRHSS